MLVEGPASFTDKINLLLDERTVCPVALYATFVDRKNRLGAADAVRPGPLHRLLPVLRLLARTRRPADGPRSRGAAEVHRPRIPRNGAGPARHTGRPARRRPRRFAGRGRTRRTQRIRRRTGPPARLPRFQRGVGPPVRDALGRPGLRCLYRRRGGVLRDGPARLPRRRPGLRRHPRPRGVHGRRHRRRMQARRREGDRPRRDRGVPHGRLAGPRGGRHEAADAARSRRRRGRDVAHALRLRPPRRPRGLRFGNAAPGVLRPALARQPRRRGPGARRRSADARGGRTRRRGRPHDAAARHQPGRHDAGRGRRRADGPATGRVPRTPVADPRRRARRHARLLHQGGSRHGRGAADAAAARSAGRQPRRSGAAGGRRAAGRRGLPPRMPPAETAGR